VVLAARRRQRSVLVEVDGGKRMRGKSVLGGSLASIKLKDDKYERMNADSCCGHGHGR
jgi:hypothetical protein